MRFAGLVYSRVTFVIATSKPHFSCRMLAWLLAFVGQFFGEFNTVEFAVRDLVAYLLDLVSFVVSICDGSL